MVGGSITGTTLVHAVIIITGAFLNFLVIQGSGSHYIKLLKGGRNWHYISTHTKFHVGPRVERGGITWQETAVHTTPAGICFAWQLPKLCYFELTPHCAWLSVCWQVNSDCCWTTNLFQVRLSKTSYMACFNYKNGKYRRDVCDIW